MNVAAATTAENVAHPRVDTGRLLGLDTVMVDVALLIERLPERGGDALSSQRLVSAGGGFNVMSAAVRQGLRAVYVGQLGTGPFADIARRALHREGISSPVVARTDIDLGVCLVLIDQGGERSFVTSPGAELTLQARDLESIDVTGDDFVYLSGYNVVYPAVADTVASWLSTLPTGAVVAFDPGPRVADIDPTLLARVMRRSDWLLCNAAEAQFLSGESETPANAQDLRDGFDCRGVVVRDGDRGCVGASVHETLHVSAFRTNVVDTNGAGDVHNGVVLANLAAGRELRECLVRANAAAALAIATLGPATCPTSALIDDLLAQQASLVATTLI